jgi:hypothetical protein
MISILNRHFNVRYVFNTNYIKNISPITDTYFVMKQRQTHALRLSFSTGIFISHGPP